MMEVLFIKPSGFVDNTFLRPLKIDILTDIVSGIGYNDAVCHTDSNLIPLLSMSLGVKLRCWYLRAEDENGRAKQKIDLQDVVFLATSMRKRGIQVDSSAAAKVKICHYNLLLVRLKVCVTVKLSCSEKSVATSFCKNMMTTPQIKGSCTRPWVRRRTLIHLWWNLNG